MPESSSKHNLDYFSPTDSKDILVNVYQETKGEIVRLVFIF